MCEYITDDGDKCGRDEQPFCFQHEETRFATLWRQINSQSRSNGTEMDTSCEDCNASLRRTERLSEHENYPKRIYFEAVVECDCAEYVLGTTSELKTNLPDGWD